MKKIITTLVILSVSIFSMMAQNSLHEKGDFSIGVGLGISGSGTFKTFPPLKVDADYTFLTFGAGSLSAGAYFSFDAYYHYILVGPMVNVRFSIAGMFDIYSKSIIGYKHYESHNRIGFGEIIGATWFFSPKLGIGTEIGYGSPTVVGVHMTFKF